MTANDSRAIIFDLGGVILNIDYQLTARAFQSLGIENFDALFSQAQQSHLFDKLETGNISPEGFRDEIRAITKQNWPDEEIDNAWNAMLLDLPEHRLNFLQRIGQQRPIFLLSNTNAIHYQAFSKYIRQSFGVPSLDSLFQKAYYSHEINRRKPDAETFEWVLEDAGLQPEATFFFDDSEQHLVSAKKLGIQAHHVPKGQEIESIVQSVMNSA